ncbi:hypothetical protein EK21DRAFT_115204 [Setomelanomma holmii]|uniref:RING-type domain-containing protein n=1 Tax=Setomelanomma holmii TaxID=210430 RepID=A0A9P4H337_9PLEO|nr:hypothetical protein EK21DRAFT_115204 [Setomelanomma holmii]
MPSFTIVGTEFPVRAFNSLNDHINIFQGDACKAHEVLDAFAVYAFMAIVALENRDPRGELPKHHLYSLSVARIWHHALNEKLQFQVSPEVDIALAHPILVDMYGCVEDTLKLMERKETSVRKSDSLEYDLTGEEQVKIVKDARQWLFNCLQHPKSQHPNLGDEEIWRRSSEDYLLECERAHIALLESPFSRNPLQCFVQVQYAKQEDEMFLYYRWLMLAATHPDADPSGMIKVILSKHFDLECLERLLFLPARYRGIWDEQIGWYVDPDDIDIRWLLDPSRYNFSRNGDQAWRRLSPCLPAEVHPNEWALYDPDTFANDPCTDFSIAHLSQFSVLVRHNTHEVADPGPDAECGICKLDFEEDVCVALNVCGHPYHLQCLEKWEATLRRHGGSNLTCCFCRKDAVQTAETAEIEQRLTKEREGVPWWQTLEQYRGTEKLKPEHEEKKMRPEKSPGSRNPGNNI